MSENPFYLFEHNGNSIYQSNSPKDLLNSFCLLNKTVTSVFFDKGKNDNKIDFKKMKECDKLNNEKKKFNNIADLSPYYLEKTNFIENTFFNEILKNKNNFEKIHKDINEFKMLQNQDKSTSSDYYHIQITAKLKQSGEIKKVEDIMKATIAQLTDYQKDNYCLISKEFEYNGNGNNQDIIFYRRVKANGNSFYISFIYQYLKSLISNKEEGIIKEIYYIMEKHLNFLNNIAPPPNSINNNSREENLGEMYISKSIKDELALNQVFGLFSLLSTNLFDKKYEKAEEILDYAFTYEEAFANFFCLYMRLQIKQFIVINKDIFTYKNYCKKKNLIEEKYYKGENFLFNEYINNNLLVKKEPSLFIISLVPYVFNVSMDLYINERYHIFNKISFDLKERDKSNNTTISILFSSFSYHIIEPKKYVTNSGNNIINNNNIDNTNTLNLANNFKNFKKDKYMININDRKCDICNQSNFVVLHNINKNPICFNCLEKTVKEILIERYEKMISERFTFIEFYLRDIPIKIYTDKDNYNVKFLSPSEFYCLFKNNLYSYFVGLIKNICAFCKKSSNILIKKDCGCLNCLTDAKKEIKYIPLSNFEKNVLFKNKKIQCPCGKENNYVELASQIFKNYNEKEKNKLLEDACSRDKEYISKYCMICGIDLKVDRIGKEKKDFKKIYFYVGKERVEHCICNECFNKNINNLNSLNCIICGEKHQDEKKEEEVNINNSQVKRSSIKNEKKNNNSEIKNSSNIKEKNNINKSNNNNSTNIKEVKNSSNPIQKSDLDLKSDTTEKKKKPVRDKKDSVCCIIY